MKQYMQISIDFDVFKGLTQRLESPTEDYNEVIRKLLNLPASETAMLPGENDCQAMPIPTNALAPQNGGAWFSNVYLPNGTFFRATYKGKTYRAWIHNSQWIDESNNIRTSPSDAASAITGNNVNGWRFWFVRRPTDEDWQRMDALKS
ncbi:MAG: DUF4357 domain-containing protein [Sphingomonadales bacterium]|nr:DUF4357 domain-containing protein [Sphingomonadales bacterium]